MQQEPERGQSGTLIQSSPEIQRIIVAGQTIPSHPIPSHPSKQTVRNCVACVACFCVRCACPPSAFAFSLPIRSRTFPAHLHPCPRLPRSRQNLKRRLQYSSNLFSSVLQLFLAGRLLLPSTNLSHARHGRLAELAANCPSAHDCEESGIKS